MKRITTILAAAAIALALTGCGSLQPKPLPDVPETATTPVQQQINDIKKQLNEVRSWATSTARAVAPNVRDDIWTADFGEQILNTTDNIMEAVLAADGYLAIGDIIRAQDRHAAARQAMIAAKREIARHGGQ